MIRKRLPLDNSTAEYAEPLADGSILSLNTPLPPVAEETVRFGCGQVPALRKMLLCHRSQLLRPDSSPPRIAAPKIQLPSTPEMVREMAHYLGIDEQNEVHLLPIAHDALVEELPKGWEERLSPTDGVPYYRISHRQGERRTSC